MEGGRGREGRGGIVSFPSLQSATVMLTDTKAKFGTLVNDVKLSPSSSVTLQCGDELKFGQGPTTGKFR